MKHKDDYKWIGLKAYNDECRSIVMRYSNEWETIIKWFGRWIDFKNDYKTMDLSFMNSVWSIFKTIYEKGLVYRGSKVMPYSVKCYTVLSNFEAGENYKDVNDPSIYITFPQVQDPNTNFIAWTTTPWTLPSNLAIAVNPKMTYVKIKHLSSGKFYILAESRLNDVAAHLKWNNTAKEKLFEVVEKMEGKQLEGIQYVPLFNYFASHSEKGCFRVLAEDFVTSGDGSGVVHCAPGFGPEDFEACARRGIIDVGNVVCPVDDAGHLVDPVTDYNGMFFKEADPKIIADLQAKGRLLFEGVCRHPYPHCWRTDSPLMYRTFKSWFIRVTDLKDDLIANN